MERPGYINKISLAFEVHPVVAILGPRQCGKTTLARHYAEQHTSGDQAVTVFDLEDPTHLALLENPKLALEKLTGLVIIDEVQRSPGLFEILRVLVDRPLDTVHFLILGSASRDLIHQSSETLAGRIGHIELSGFSIPEVGLERMDQRWLRGGFPRSFLAQSDGASQQWRKDYITTYLERDIPSLGLTIAPSSLRRFWMMLAHYHGQLLNFSELGRSFGATDKTVRRYIDLLNATFMVRQLPAWYENIKKRQVKSPKLYIRDSGIYHTLLGVPDTQALQFHPKLGPSWEGFMIEELIRRFEADPGECYFWSVHGQSELDLFIIKDGRRLGFEIKYTDSPRVTKSMLAAQRDLELDALTIVYPGRESIALRPGIEAKSAAHLLNREIGPIGK